VRSHVSSSSCFLLQVRAYKLEFRKRSFFKYSTGAEAAYPEMDATATDLLALRKVGGGREMRSTCSSSRPGAPVLCTAMHACNGTWIMLINRDFTHCACHTYLVTGV
jgi:hypothetical protein